jgi:hypothetical protein
MPAGRGAGTSLSRGVESAAAAARPFAAAPLLGVLSDARAHLSHGPLYRLDLLDRGRGSRLKAKDVTRHSD